MNLPKTKELEKGLQVLLKKEGVSFRKVAVDIIGADSHGYVLEYSVRVANDNYEQIRRVLLRNFTNILVETEFKLVRGILFIEA